MDMNALTGRLMRVLRFDASVYKEIAADNTAMMQAGIVVTVAALLAGLNSLINVSVVAYIVGAVLAIVGFFIYAAVATGVAKLLFKGKTDFNEMGRTLGYAYAWYAVGLLALIPAVGGILTFVGSILAWVAGVIALRESAEFDTVKAVVTVLIAGLVSFVIVAVATVPVLVILGASSR